MILLNCKFKISKNNTKFIIFIILSFRKLREKKYNIVNYLNNIID